MKGSTFDPSRLRGTAKHQEDAGYAMVGQMLREYLGGDPLEEARRRALTDPKLRAMLIELSAAFERAADAVAAEQTHRGYSPTAAAAFPRKSDPSRM
jgi:hypothetical protein